MKKLDALTSLRFFAAMAIVIEHTKDAFHVTAWIHSPIPYDYGVSFFFVLSGFILTYNYREIGDFAACRRFYVARFARIWPLHVDALSMKYQLFRVGKVWHYRFQVGGDRIQRSTREAVKHRAEAVAERAFRQARMWARGEEPVPTLREHIAQWLVTHTPTASRSHVKIVETFRRLHLYDLGDLFIDELSTERVEAARVEHVKTHAPASVNLWLKILRLLCNWAVRRKVIPAVPFTVKLLKVQKRPRQILSIRLAQEWLDAIDRVAGDHHGVAVAVRLMLGIGLREAEAITARWEWLDWDRGLYTPGITKGREADPIPLPAWLADYLAPMRKSTGLIVVKLGGNGFAHGFTRRAMLRANEACGTGHITAHRLRGTFATLLSESGVPVQTIQRVMRHKSPLTTMAYLEVNLSHVVSAQARIAERVGLVSSDERKHSGEEVANTTDASA